MIESGRMNIDVGAELMIVCELSRVQAEHMGISVASEDEYSLSLSDWILLELASLALHSHLHCVSGLTGRA